MSSRYCCWWAPAMAIICMAVAFQPVPAAGKPAEPTVTSDEARLLEEIAVQAENNRSAAIARLRASVGETSSAALHFALGGLLYRDGDHAAAEAAYLEAVERSDDFARAWYQLGLTRLQLDRPAAAAAALRRSLEKGRPADAELWRLLGYCYLSIDELVPAEAAYRQSLLLAPGHRETERGLVNTLLGMELFREALVLLRRMCSRASAGAELWRLRAGAHLDLGEHRRALEVLECAALLDLLDAEARLTLGDLYYNRGMVDQAMRRYERAFAEGGVGAGRMLRYVRIMYQAGRYQEASRTLQAARVRGIDDSGEGHYLAGVIADALGNQERALSELQSAVEADPLSGEALLALGDLLWNTGRHEEALLTVERASRLKEFRVRAFIQLAGMEVERDHYRRAADYLISSQEIEPNPNVERYLNQINRLIQTEE